VGAPLLLVCLVLHYELFCYLDPVDMGIAQYFALFGGTAVVQESGASGTLNGAVGSGSGSLDSAFTVNGMRFTSDATTLQVAKDITAAMANCSGRAK
jgi:hypothetical protein